MVGLLTLAVDFTTEQANFVPTTSIPVDDIGIVFLRQGEQPFTIIPGQDSAALVIRQGIQSFHFNGFFPSGTANHASIGYYSFRDYTFVPHMGIVRTESWLLQGDVLRFGFAANCTRIGNYRFRTDTLVSNMGIVSTGLNTLKFSFLCKSLHRQQ